LTVSKKLLILSIKRRIKMNVWEEDYWWRSKIMFYSINGDEINMDVPGYGEDDFNETLIITQEDNTLGVKGTKEEKPFHYHFKLKSLMSIEKIEVKINKGVLNIKIIRKKETIPICFQ
jgi:hypothetical protein